MNERPIPRLKGELRSGVRVVSQQFDMGLEGSGEETQDVDGLMIYVWTIG